MNIYDLEKAFDSLWLEDCLNDLFDTLPKEQCDDKLALIYEANRNNLEAVKTAVGLTDRVNIEKTVTQGGTFGPIQCSNSIDKVGQKCFEKGEHLFVYKKMVRVLPLSMVDDLLTIARCGTASLALNKHTPDINEKRVISSILARKASYDLQCKFRELKFNKYVKILIRVIYF